MKLFTDDGYLDMDAIINTKLPYLLIVGARGVGKTYGSLKHVLTTGKKFIFMRTTQTQIDLLNKPDFSPMKTIARDMGINIVTKPITRYNAGFYIAEENDSGDLVPVGSPIGYTMALSTVSSMRGWDASDCEILLYDEFIPEEHERKLKGMGRAFLNAVETISRNREDAGRPPLQVVCMANSNDIGNPIFTELKIIAKVERMILKNQTYSLDYQRGLGIFLINEAGILTRKAGTSLYKLAEGTDYADMALKNQFSEMKYNSVRPQPIGEYKPLCTIGEITFYKHKSQRRYYCTTLKMGTPETFAATDTDIRRWLRKYDFLWTAYMKDLIDFEDVAAEVIYRHYVD